MLNCDEMMEMFHYMEDKNIILSIDLADGNTQVQEMKEIIQECPQLKIAIGHFGMVTTPHWQEQIKLARHTHVMIEDKLMWGSDYPRTITAITYKMSYDFILKTTEMTQEEKALFLGKNAERFYGFKNLISLPYIKNMSE